MLEKIKSLAKEYKGEMIANRRWLHSHPELGNEELKTSAFIQQKLTEMGIEFKAGVAKTGVVGIIKGKKGPGKTLLIRADIDALPMPEKTGADYQSQHPGICHACGHDVHTATLLGTAKILSALQDHFTGTVKLCFQPAEEAATGGAQLMVAENILEGVDAAVGLHVRPDKEVGYVSVEKGPISSYPDFFSITFKGKGGHGSFPSRSLDPLLPAVSAYNMISLIHKKVSPLEPCVVQVCMIQAGTAQAVIPEEATIQGTVRTLHLHNRQIVQTQLEKIAKSVCDVFDVTYDFNYRGRCSPVINDEAMTNLVRTAVAPVFPKGFYQNEGMKIGGEDFCFFSDIVPSCFFLVGSSDGTAATSYPVHNPMFNVDENVLELTSAAFAHIAVTYLSA